MCISIGSVKIHIGFLFAAAVCLYLNSSYSSVFMLAFVSALLHEMMHLSFLISYGCKNIELTLLPSGAKISGASLKKLNYRQNIAVSLSAPVFNIILSVLLFFAYRKFTDMRILQVSELNFLLGAVNLLPMSFLDGGSAFFSLLCIKKDLFFAENVLFVCDTAVLLLLLTVIVFFMFIRIDFTAVLIFFVYCLLNTVKKCRKT